MLKGRRAVQRSVTSAVDDVTRSGLGVRREMDLTAMKLSLKYEVWLGRR